MTNRKKGLQKGIDSLKKQIEVHENKRQIAEKEGKVELAGYYCEELIKLKSEKTKKEDHIKK